MDEGREQNQQSVALDILGTTELPRSPKYTLTERGVVICRTDDYLEAIASMGSKREH